MTTKRLTTTLQYFGYVLLGLFCLLIILFSIERQTFESRVYRNTSLVGIDVSYLNQAEFFTIVEGLEHDISEKTIYLSHDQEVTEVRASDIGLGFDKQVLWQKVYGFQKRENIIEDFAVWLGSFFQKTTFLAETFADPLLLDIKVEQWSSEVPQTPAFNGGIEVVGVQTELRLPKPGTEVDSERLEKLVVETLLKKAHGTIVAIPLTFVEPERKEQELVDLQHSIDTFISLPIILYSPEHPRRNFTLGIRDLAQMVLVSIPEDSQKPAGFQIDDEVLVSKLGDLYPREAEFVMNEEDQTVAIIPSQEGFDLDINQTAENILEIGKKRSSRRAKYIVDSYIVPSFSTRDAEDLNIEHLVSQFTTYHPCCADRVENIHLVADILDGKILEPGEVLNMNEFLGERTEERGFKSAGTIIKGRLQESVGGGISQFITTLHNAVYWGGYQVIAHKPHTIYFSRYPQGIEATINWPYVDYIFKNDSGSGMYIDASYTDTSITISIYGSNDGRSVVGAHQGGTSLDITEGGENARKVISKVSERYNYKLPLIQYLADESLAGREEVIQSIGDARFSVNVLRTIEQAGEILSYDSWPVHYHQDSTIVRKHPCYFFDEDFDYSQC